MNVDRFSLFAVAWLMVMMGASLLYAQPFSPEQVEAMVKADNAEMYAEAMANAKTRADRIRIDETGFGKNPMLSIATLDDWMKQFDGEILDPPIEFDMREPVPYDNSTSMKALRYFWHGHYNYKQDADKLLEMIDEEATTVRVAYSEGRKGIDWRDPFNQDLLESTKVTVLLTAKYEWGDYTYDYYFCRLSHPDNPQERGIIYFPVVLRRDPDTGKYLFTYDLTGSRISFLMSYGVRGGTQGRYVQPFGSYEHLYELLHDSHFPKHFYTFE